MIKTVKLGTNNLPQPPASICQQGTNTPLDEIDVDLDLLCHQLFLDSHGPVVPVPNPAVASLLVLLSTSAAFEFVGSGPGTHKEIRIAESNKYGKAFCRWFLYTHFGMTYFHHMDHIFKGGLPAPFNTWTLKRSAKGDTPDYACVGGGPALYLGEAKGTQAKVAFTDAKFTTWRQQFGRVELKDPNQVVRKIKGYIVATLMRNTAHAQTFQSKVLAEDPDTPGDEGLLEDEANLLRLAVVAGHYAGVFDRFGLPLHAAALRSGFQIPEDTRHLGLWQCRLPSLRDKRFIGGLYPPPEVPPFTPIYVRVHQPTPERQPQYYNTSLVSPTATFFGLDNLVYRPVRSALNDGLLQLTGVEEQAVPALVQGVTYLRDGTLIAPAEFMELQDVINV